MKDEPITSGPQGQEPNVHPSGSSIIPQPSSFLHRWWTYQRERFPIVAHGILILAFSSSAVSFSLLLRSQSIDVQEVSGKAKVLTVLASHPSPLAPFLVAFGTAFLFFLQLRIADEFKDFEEDSRYRPYRAVPRGLVSLRELGVLGVIAAAIQLVLGLALDPSIVLLLAVAWLYLAMMSKEFFVGEWLKQHPVPYLISHMVIIPIVDFYATACDWWPVGQGTPHGLGWFVAASYSNGIVIEIGRKIRAPADEEVGVNTYSALWGPRTAVLVWLAAMLTTGICATLAAAQIDFVIPVATVLAGMLLTAAIVVWRFLAAPTKRGSKGIETLAGVWTILLYLSVGAVPLLWRWSHS